MRLPGEEKTPIAERVKLRARVSSLAWRVRVKRSGNYLLWMRVRSRTKEVKLTISADGKTVAEPRLFFGWYDARATGMMWGDVKKAYRWFWTEAPNYLALDARPVRFVLSQGEHLIKLGGIPPGLDMDAIVLTSDYAWIPEGSVNYY